MKLKRWTSEEDKYLVELVNDDDGLSWDDIGDILNRKPDACRKRYERLSKKHGGWQRDEYVVRQSIVYDPTNAPSWRERAEIAKRVKDIRSRDDPFVNMADVTIETKTPIGVLFTSDWQFGSLGVDYNTWIEHIDAFIREDGLFMVVNGDLICNTYIHKTLAAVWSQVMSPEEQMNTISGLADDLIQRRKLIAMTLSEEHDQKDERVTGMSTLVQMIKNKGIPLFNNRGTILLRVGNYVYVIYCVHASRFRSSFNAFHSASREFQLGVPANVVVTSHTHRPAIAQYTWYTELEAIMNHMQLPIRLGGTVYSVQTGTYETESKYSCRFFTTCNMPKLQILMFWPDTFRIEPVESVDAARRVINEYKK